MTEQTDEAAAAAPREHASRRDAYPGAVGRHARTDPGSDHVNPALQQLDPRPIRDIHHGRTGAMWTAVAIMTVAFVIGGIAMLGPNIPALLVSAGIFLIGIIVGLVLRALGYGLHVRG